MVVGLTLWRFSGLLFARTTTRRVCVVDFNLLLDMTLILASSFRFQVQRPIATSTGSLLATFTGIATGGGQVERRAKKIQDILTIAANANQRNTRSILTNNRPTRSLEQTKLRDVQQRPTGSWPNSLRDNIGIYLFPASGPHDDVRELLRSFPAC